MPLRESAQHMISRSSCQITQDPSVCRHGFAGLYDLCRTKPSLLCTACLYWNKTYQLKGTDVLYSQASDCTCKWEIFKTPQASILELPLKSENCESDSFFAAKFTFRWRDLSSTYPVQRIISGRVKKPCVCGSLWGRVYLELLTNNWVWDKTRDVLTKWTIVLKKDELIPGPSPVSL